MSTNPSVYLVASACEVFPPVFRRDLLPRGHKRQMNCRDISTSGKTHQRVFPRAVLISLLSSSFVPCRRFSMSTQGELSRFSLLDIQGT